jgi:hypothetical protein
MCTTRSEPPTDVDPTRQASESPLRELLRYLALLVAQQLSNDRSPHPATHDPKGHTQ